MHRSACTQECVVSSVRWCLRVCIRQPDVCEHICVGVCTWECVRASVRVRVSEGVYVCSPGIYVQPSQEDGRRWVGGMNLGASRGS